MTLKSWSDGARPHRRLMDGKHLEVILMFYFLESESSSPGSKSSDPVMAVIKGELDDGERSPLEFSAESSDLDEIIVPMSEPDPLELDKPIGEDEFVREARRAGIDPVTGSDERAIQTRSGSDPGNNRRRAYNIGTLNDTKFYSDSVSRRDRKDFYKFTLEEEGEVDISLSGLRKNADLFLHNSRGKAIEKSRNGGRRSEAISETLEAGDYYVQVRSRNRRVSTNYNLELNFSSSGEDEDIGGTGTLVEEPPVNERAEWQGWVSKWDASSGAPSPVNINDNKDFELVGKLNLGSNIREITGDGRHGINNADWGWGPVNGDYRLPTDHFLVKAYTEVDLEGGQTYEFEAKGDDGYQIWLKNLDTNEWRWVTPENQWQSTVGRKAETDKFTHTIPGDKGGRYYVGFFQYENDQEAYFGLNWKEKEESYFNELATWSDDQWDWAAGDNTRITGPIPGWGETDERNYQGHHAILQIYNDLTTAILDKTYRSSAGYVQDPSYFYSSAGRQYGWHSGIDIDTDNWVPTDVKALVGGTARVVQWEEGNQFLEIAGDDGRFYWYGHLSDLKVSSGRVNQGDVIGELGMSSASNHLHFQVNETQSKPAGYNSEYQDKVYQWTLNPLKVFWELKREGRI